MGMDWQKDAACQREDPEMWFSEGRANAKAKRICNSCPVRPKCLQWSLDEAQQWGMWGGVSQQERRQMILKSHRLTVVPVATTM